MPRPDSPRTTLPQRAARHARDVPRLLALVSLGLACSTPEAAPIVPPPPDPCVALRAEIDAIHTRHACGTDADCVLGRGVLPAGAVPSSRPGRYGLEGPEREAAPCGAAIHHDDLSALDEALSRFASAGCGPVSEAGSTACVPSSHGARATCHQGRCTLAL